MLAQALDSKEEGVISGGEVMDVDDGQVEVAVNVAHTLSFDNDLGQAGIVKEEEVEGEGGLFPEGSGIANPPVIVRALRETVEGGQTVFILDDSSDDEDPLYQAEYAEYEGGVEAGGYANEPAVTGNADDKLGDASERMMWDAFDSDSALTDLEDEGGEVGVDDTHKSEGDKSIVEHGGEVQ
ncbi:hypothetical protein FA13DRAFT_1806346 [Coprinellus micaceus]|uniref:Uncharacterized protein n=1 Tax=Coprinellus micaceus TaxID=71717 RepID=A0A4Y7RMW1_COPMI|nr:hypothetical protein FA13DRAFT_1806346 [Coprinellus micaceus]